jgi:hypothetical protein
MFEEDGIMANQVQGNLVQLEKSFQMPTSKPRTNGLMDIPVRSLSSWMTSIKEECVSVIILRSGRIVMRAAGRSKVVRYH